MPDYHKKLVLARVVEGRVEEVRVSTFHRAFKKRKAEEGLGGQKKKKGRGGEKEKEELVVVVGADSLEEGNDKKAEVGEDDKSDDKV
jgi:hypothetical protein